MVAWNTNFLGIRDTTAQVVDFLKPYWEQFSNDVKKLRDKAKEAFEGIKSAIDQFVAVAVPLVQGFVNDIVGFWKSNRDNIASIVGGVWEIIKGNISGALQIIEGVFQVFSGLFSGNWSMFWDGIQNIV